MGKSNNSRKGTRKGNKTKDHSSNDKEERHRAERNRAILNTAAASVQDIGGRKKDW